MFDLFKNLFGGGTDTKGLIQNGATIIDVRTPGEFQSGHAKNSINIPLNTLGNKINKIKKYQQPIVTCCASGMRSGRAASMLKENGIEAYNGGPWQNVDIQ